MTARRVLEWVIPAALFTRPPCPGDYYASGKGRTALAVTTVRRIVGTRSTEAYRLLGLRVRVAELPAGVIALPHPQPPPPTPRRPPPAAADLPVPIIVKPLVARREQRRKVVELLTDDRDMDRQVHKVRVANGTAVSTEWRDPDDVSTVRRTAKVVRGYRMADVIDTLLTIGTLGKKQAGVALRFRKIYELGEIGLRAGKDLSGVPASFAAGEGPSESRLVYLSLYRDIKKTLGPRLLDVMLSVIINGDTITRYAERRQMNRSVAVGWFLGAIEATAVFFEGQDAAARELADQIEPQK